MGGRGAPEIASRRHSEAISGVVRQALEDAGCTLEEIDAIAVTYAPGLIGALLVGRELSKRAGAGSGPNRWCRCIICAAILPPTI